jgi:hypothetical protein
VAFVRKAADEIKIMTFFKSSGIKIMNDHVVVSNNLKKYFSVLVTSCLGQYVAHWLLVASCWSNEGIKEAYKEAFKAVASNLQPEACD